MKRWELAACDPKENDGAELLLLNDTQTVVSVNSRTGFDPVPVFNSLARAGIPIEFTEGIEQIRFTRLPGDAGGYYMGGKIWVDVGDVMRTWAVDTLIHEIGHHVDAERRITSRMRDLPSVKHMRFLGEKLSKLSHDERFAVGFQKFYTRQRTKLRKTDADLYRTIMKLHQECSSRG